MYKYTDRLTTVREILVGLRCQVENGYTHRERNKVIETLIDLITTWQRLDREEEEIERQLSLREDEIPF